jgi:signal transduction histidine kinase
MTLNLRFILLLGLLFALFLGGLGLLKSSQKAEAAETVLAAQRERSRLLDEIIALVGYPLSQFTRDYSLWDEMVQFVEKPTDDWARINLQASIDTFRLRAIWVLRPDGTLIHTAAPTSDTSPPGLPLKTADIPRLSKTAPFNRFFVHINGELCEILACPIQPSNDIPRTSPPRGWLIAAWRWDDAHLATVGKLTDASASLVPFSPGSASSKSESGFELTRPLNGLDGFPVASLKLGYNPAALEATEVFNRDELLIFVLQGSLLIIVTALCIHRWVLAPVRSIIASLRASDPAPIAPLARRRDETGLIARLVQSHFADQQTLVRNERALAHTLAERVRLGRDLHDNVIQALFATGMSLSATRNFVRTSPAQAEEGLEKVRASLNQVIRDVRTFIVGLEPDSLDDKTFAQATAALTDALRSIRSSEFEIDIDETAALTLSPDLRQHALQLIREALLNSIRHTGASRLHISLQGSNDNVILSLADNGAPTSPAETTPAGLGLASIAERAALVGAVCEIAPLPQQGTRIRVRYPLSSALPA